MNDLPHQKLCQIVATYGKSLCDDPKRCEALLRDLCGQHRREVNVLVSALKERVAADLRASSTGVPREVLLARLTKRLCDNLGLAEEAARWGVESWALALGVISSQECIGIGEDRSQLRPYSRTSVTSIPTPVGSPSSQHAQVSKLGPRGKRQTPPSPRISKSPPGPHGPQTKPLPHAPAQSPPPLPQPRAAPSVSGYTLPLSPSRGWRLLWGLLGCAALVTFAIWSTTKFGPNFYTIWLPACGVFGLVSWMFRPKLTLQTVPKSNLAVSCPYCDHRMRAPSHSVPEWLQCPSCDSAFVAFRCPHCAQQIEAIPEQAGERRRCPSCRKGMFVPTGLGNSFDKKVARVRKFTLASIWVFAGSLCMEVLSFFLRSIKEFAPFLGLVSLVSFACLAFGTMFWFALKGYARVKRRPRCFADVENPA
jgi:ribosomal protein S27E